jgi:DNA polymerase (family 10)
MDIMFIHPNELPWYLLYFGSSKEYSKKIRQEAIQKGYKLSEKGIFDRKTGKQIDFQPKTEKNIFSFLEIPYIPPSKRI